MNALIVDPTNENVALIDGALAGALRVGPAGTATPTAADLNSRPIIGYSLPPAS